MNSTEIKVYGYHIDFYQHVNNACYLEFLEAARWEWLEDSETLAWMNQKQIAFMVVNININYRQPAFLGDRLHIQSELMQLNNKSGVLSQVITRQPDGTTIADATVTFVCVDGTTQKALPLVGELHQRLVQSTQFVEHKSGDGN